jgi:hypothetical protein
MKIPYDSFSSTFVRDIGDEIHQENRCIRASTPIQLDVNGLFELYEGSSFNNGIYRVIRSEDISIFTSSITSAFPRFMNRFVPFGYDWLGRFFCLDRERIDNGKHLVLLFSGFTNEVLEIPLGIVEFHDHILVEQCEAALECTMFSKFLLAAGIISLPQKKCADMILPLYMGGAYKVENMKIEDINVSWEINAQLLSQLKAVEEGTKIEKITLRVDS